MSASDVVVVVVSYNSAAHVRALLRSLRGEGAAGVLVWDNGSRAADVAELRDVCASAGARLVESPRNLGFGAAANRAVALARQGLDARYAWLLNPDVVVRPGALDRLVTAADDRGWALTSPLVLMAAPGGGPDRVWFAGGRLDERAGRSVHVGIGRPVPPGATDEPRRTEFVTGAAPLIRLRDWDALGGFAEDLFLYCEDAELAVRCRRQGRAVGVAPGAVVEHWEGGSSGGRGPGPTFYYYVQRNRLLVYRHAASRRQLLLGRGAGETLRLLLLPFRPPRRDSVACWAASVAGLVAGLRGRRGPRRPVAAVGAP